MLLLKRLQLLVPFEVGPAIFADGLEHRVSRASVFRLLRGEQRFVDELPNMFEDGYNSVATADRLGRIEREPAREHRGAAKDTLLLFIQQPVAPVHRGPERFVAGVGGPASA